MANGKIGEYTFSFIKEVLMTLRANDYDMPHTVGMFDGVSARRITDWRAKFGEVLYSSSPLVIKDADVGIKAKREIETEPLRAVASEVTDELLAQILQKLQTGGNTSLRELTNTFKEVVPYIMPKFDKDNKVGTTSVEATYEVFMQNIYSKLKGNVKQEKLTIKSTQKK